MSARSMRALGMSLACGLAIAPAVAQSGQFKSSLPETTLAFVSFPDISASIAEMEGMPLMKMWREAEVQDFFADGLKMLGAHWEEGIGQARGMHEAGQLPFSPDDLKKLRVESFGVALTSVEFSEPIPRIGIMLHADFGQSAPVWKNVIKSLLEMAVAQSHGEAEKKDSKIGDIEMITISPTEEEDMPMGLHVAFVGNGVLVGTLVSEVEAAVENFGSDEATSTLTKTAAYNDVAKNLRAQGAEAECYIRPGLFLDALVHGLELAKKHESEFPPWLDPQGVDRALDAMGLRAIQGIGMTSSYEGDRCVTTGFIAAPAPLRKGLLAGGDKVLDLGFLRWVPKDAVSFSGSSFEIMNVYDALVSAVKAYDPEMGEQILAMLAQYEEQIGLSVKEDLFGAFGNELYSWSMPMAAFGAAPELAFLLKVKDEERLMKTLQTVAKMSNGMLELDEVERRGITAHQIRINIPFDGGMGGFNPMDMFIPTFAFKDGFMVVGLSTGDVKRVFTRMDREDDPKGDIRSNPEFAPYLAKLPEKGINSVSFTDWKAQFEGIYQILTSLLAFVPMDENIPVDLSLLPDSSTLTQHLCGSIGWSQAGGSGYRTTSIGPFGPETIAIVTACGIAAGTAGFAMMTRSEGMRFR